MKLVVFLKKMQIQLFEKLTGNERIWLSKHQILVCQVLRNHYKRDSRARVIIAIGLFDVVKEQRRSRIFNSLIEL